MLKNLKLKNAQKTREKERRKLSKRNRGITLIALVITIIVLLILAGISIAMLTGENGILTRANDAKKEWNEAEKQEEERLNQYEQVIMENMGEITKNGIWTLEKNTQEYCGYVKLTIRSVYYQEPEMTLWQYKERYVVKEMYGSYGENTDGYKLDSFLLTQGGGNSDIYFNHDYAEAMYISTGEEVEGTVETFVPEETLDEFLMLLGYTEENILEIEKEYEEYIQKVLEEKEEIVIPDEYKNKTYTITFPDNTTKEISGQDLATVNETYIAKSKGTQNISIKDTSDEVNLKVNTDNYIERKYEDEYYEYTAIRGGYWAEAKNEDLTEYGEIAEYINGIPVISIEYAFSYCNNLIKPITKIPENTKYMTSTFQSCDSLETINLEKYNTKNVVDMNSLFNDCSNLKEIQNLQKIDTSNVKDIGKMFWHCKKLEKIDFSNNNIENVENMTAIFRECNALREINFGNFKANKLKYMGSAFFGCNSLENLDLSNFNTENLMDLGDIFYDCTNLKNLKIDNFDYSKVKSVESMFYGCKNLQTTIKLNTPVDVLYEDMFLNAATATEAEIQIYYTKELEDAGIIDAMIATGTGNLLKKGEI